MTRAGKRKAIQLGLFILGTLARGMTAQGVGSGALLGLGGRVARGGRDEKESWGWK
jgi:hypothetical protein